MIINKDGFEILSMNSKKIVIKGIGRLFYESGFPIALSLDFCKENNLEFNIYTLIDELQKEWSKKTILKKLSEELSDGNLQLDYKAIEEFLDSAYEEQRDIIFKSLLDQSEVITKEFLEYLV